MPLGAEEHHHEAGRLFPGTSVLLSYRQSSAPAAFIGFVCLNENAVVRTHLSADGVGPSLILT